MCIESWTFLLVGYVTIICIELHQPLNNPVAQSRKVSATFPLAIFFSTLRNLTPLGILFALLFTPFSYHL